ncbi:MAG TPA: type II toxin-antitoxin system Phd/YefM family antitoxin [Terracidiphilus sp.]|nr:type II toxin-antitoxin system Phd/YefM family antitoxin [Terracidiphilus sp.]
MITKTSAEAQNNFGQLLDTAQREPVAITRHGRTAAFVISPTEMEELQRLRDKRRKKIATDWESWREKARKSMTPEAAALTDEEVNRMVHELR